MVDLLLLVAAFAAAFAIMYAMIARVPQMLHTPLMSMTNSISAVTILGAILLFSAAGTSAERMLAAVAIVAATFNLIGGFVITDRMLGLFRKKGSSGSGD